MSASSDPLLRPYYVREIPGTHEGRFVAEGRHNVTALIRKGLVLESVLFVGDAHPDMTAELPAGVLVFRPDKAEALKIFGAEFVHGVAAVVRAPKKARLSQALPDFLAANAPARTVVVCPCLGDASNLGAIIRNAAAFGADAVICGEKGVSPWSRKAVRAASGTMWSLPVMVSPDLHGDLDEAAANPEVILAATRLAPDAIALPDWKPAGRHLIILMGGESHGLAPEWLRHRHDAVVIPMAAGVDSLNVAASSAVVLYHVQNVMTRR